MIGLFNLVQTVALITPLIAIPHYVSTLILYTTIHQLVDVGKVMRTNLGPTPRHDKRLKISPTANMLGAQQY